MCLDALPLSYTGIKNPRRKSNLLHFIHTDKSIIDNHHMRTNTQKTEFL